MIALGCVNSWLLTPLAAAQADVRKQACLSAYAEAQEQRMRGELLHAREQLLLCSREDCPRPIAQDCTDWLREVEADLSSVVFAVSDGAGHDLASASVQINGKPLADLSDGRAQLLDPGPYDYSVEAPGFTRVDGTLVMRQSEKNRIVRVQLEKVAQSQQLDVAAISEKDSMESQSDSGFRLPTASIVLGATAVVGIASFAYFGMRGQALRSDADSCSSSCQALIDAGKRDYTIADISLGVAVAAASSALVVVLLDHDAAPSTAPMHLAVAPNRLEWNVRF